MTRQTEQRALGEAYPRTLGDDFCAPRKGFAAFALLGRSHVFRLLVRSRKLERGANFGGVHGVLSASYSEQGSANNPWKCLRAPSSLGKNCRITVVYDTEDQLWCTFSILAQMILQSYQQPGENVFFTPWGFRPRNREDQHIFYPGSWAIVHTSNKPRMLRAPNPFQPRGLHPPQHQSLGSLGILLAFKPPDAP